MNLIKEIEKNNYTKEYSKNGGIGYQNIKQSLVLEKNQILMSSLLHVICPPMSEDDFEAFEAELGIKLNKNLVDFYNKYNGVQMFSGAFSIYGFGRVLINGHYLSPRGMDDICSPYHLIDENNGAINEEKIKLGSLCDKPLYYNNKTGVLTYEDDGKVEQWQSLDDGIEDIYNGLYAQYLPNGVVKNPTIIDNYVFNTPEHFRQQASEATEQQKS